MFVFFRACSRTTLGLWGRGAPEILAVGNLVAPRVHGLMFYFEPHEVKPARRGRPTYRDGLVCEDQLTCGESPQLFLSSVPAARTIARWRCVPEDGP